MRTVGIGWSCFSPINCQTPRWATLQMTGSCLAWFAFWRGSVVFLKNLPSNSSQAIKFLNIYTVSWTWVGEKQDGVRRWKAFGVFLFCWSRARFICWMIYCHEPKMLKISMWTWTTLRFYSSSLEMWFQDLKKSNSLAQSWRPCKMNGQTTRSSSSNWRSCYHSSSSRIKECYIRTRFVGQENVCLLCWVFLMRGKSAAISNLWKCYPDWAISTGRTKQVTWKKDIDWCIQCQQFKDSNKMKLTEPMSLGMLERRWVSRNRLHREASKDWGWLPPITTSVDRLSRWVRFRRSRDRTKMLTRPRRSLQTYLSSMVYRTALCPTETPSLLTNSWNDGCSWVECSWICCWVVIHRLTVRLRSRIGWLRATFVVNVRTIWMTGTSCYLLLSLRTTMQCLKV